MMLVRKNYQPMFNSLVDEFLKNDWSDRLDSEYNFAKPKTNISETEKAFVIDMLVPGFKKKDLQINVEDDLLTVSVAKEEKKEEKKEETTAKTFFREFEIKNFKRSFRLSHKVDKENIEASFSNGILSINVPKLEEAYVKKMIEVK